MIRDRSRLAVFGLALVLTLSAPQARAQGPGGGGPGFRGPGGGGVMGLINNSAVKEELELTPEQEAKLKELNDSSAQGRRQVFQAMREQAAAAAAAAADAGDGAGGPATLDRAAMQEAMTAFQQKTEAALAKILTKSQRTRLEQISLQQQGPLAVAKPEVARKINLTPIQLDMVQEVVSQMEEARRQQFAAQRETFRARRAANAGGGGGAGDPAGGNAGGAGNGGGGNRGGGRPDFNDPAVREQFDKMRKDSEKIRDQALAKIGKLLRPNQKAAFNKLLGKPFDVSKLRPNFGGRGPGAPAPGNAPAPANAPATGGSGSGGTKAADRPAAARRPS